MTIDKLREAFKNPSREYGPTPFLALNNDLSEKSLRFVLQELKAKGIAGVFMHPRSGLEIEYLSEEFWERMGLLIRLCEEHGLCAWIYDDYNWPSGPCGGKLLDEHPEFTQQYIDYVTVRKPAAEEVIRHPGHAIAAFSLGTVIKDLSSQIANGKLAVDEGSNADIMVWYEDVVTDNMFVTSNAPWCKYRAGYLDLLNPAAVEAFMDLTHRQYARRFSKYFGKTIPGVFTDEPQQYRGFPWTNNLGEAFEKKYGYDLRPRLYQLAQDRDRFQQTRIDYYRLVQELYTESFFKKIAGWCTDHNLKLTGHLGMEERLSQIPVNHGGVYGPYAAMQMPGIDALGDGNGLSGDLVNMESPNFAPKAASSAAHAAGHERVLCEVGGGCGWQTSLHRLRTQLNWLFATGVNFMNPHHVLLSLKGCRKRDFPATHFVQEPWWEFYGMHSAYIQRLSHLLTRGTHKANVTILFPLRAIWSVHRGRVKENKESDLITQSLDLLINALLENQIDFDFLFEDALYDKRVKADGNQIVMGQERFSVLLVPPAIVIDSLAVMLMERFAAAGGKIIFLGPLPGIDDEGKPITETLLHLTRSGSPEKSVIQIPNYAPGREASVIETIGKLCPADLIVHGPLSREIIYQRRDLKDGEVYFITHLGNQEGEAGLDLASLLNQGGEVGLMFHSEKEVLEHWDPESGETRRVPYDKKEEGYLSTTMQLYPGQAAVFVLHNQGNPLSIQATNFTVTYADDKIVEGYGEASEPEIKRDKKYIAISSGAIPPALILPADWKIKPESPNFYIIEPWKVETSKTPLPRISEMLKDHCFSKRTHRLIRIGRVAVPLINAIKRPESKYRTERYFNFGAAETMTGITTRITGIDLYRHGLYMGLDALQRMAGYIGIRTIMRSFPPPGCEYEASSSFKVEYIPEDLCLVYEDLGVPLEIWINDRKPIAEARPEFVWDFCNKVLPVADLVRQGLNTIRIRSRQLDWPTLPPSFHSIEYFMLRGSFEVRKRILQKPLYKDDGYGVWVSDGYPYYSGAMYYEQTFTLPAEYLKYYLMLYCGEVCETLEVSINDQNAGLRLGPPYAVPVNGLVKEGQNKIRLRVTNTGANMFAAQVVSGLIGAVRIRPYHRVRFEMKD